MLISSGPTRATGAAKASRPLRFYGLFFLCAGLAVGTSGCGGSGGTPTARPTGPTYEVTSGVVGGLGTVLVDGKGFTLYLFVPDHRSSRSTCYDVCAVAWPPLLLPSGKTKPLAGPGVKASLLGTTTRKGGQIQVTYNGWPLYLWANDGAPGEATGQGINNLGGLWYVVSVKGSAIR